MATNQQQVIVIGAGYDGLLATIRLAGKVRRQNVQITLISGSDKFVERVRLHQMATGRDIGAILWWLENDQPCSPEQLAGWLSQLTTANAGFSMRPHNDSAATG